MNISSAIKGSGVLRIGIGVLTMAILGLFVWLAFLLPDPSVFNANVEKIFVETDLSTQVEIKLLEVLASSGSLFEASLSLHLQIITTLILLSFALTLAVVGLVLSNLSLRSQYQDMRNQVLSITSLRLNREENRVNINESSFKLTQSNIETLALLLEARLDDDYLSGVQIESIITGKPESDCEEAAGVVRVKRLRDALGNQIVSELLLRHVSGRGYLLDVHPGRISLG